MTEAKTNETFELDEQSICLFIEPNNEGPLASGFTAPVLQAKKIRAYLDFGESDERSFSIIMQIDPSELQVVSPILPKKEMDKISRIIRAEILETALFPYIIWHGNGEIFSADLCHVSLKGTLLLHGISKDFDIALNSKNADFLEGNLLVKQSSFGIEPVSAFMGALRSADQVKIRFEIRKLPCFALK